MTRSNKSLASLPWSTVDWSQANTVIAAALNCSHSTVAHYRYLHTGTTPRQKTSNPLHQFTEWATTSNAKIARQFGITRLQAQSFRNKFGHPAGPRSPGSGLWRKHRAPRNWTKREKAARLDAVWALLWPEDPNNNAGRDEVEAIKNLTKTTTP